METANELREIAAPAPGSPATAPQDRIPESGPAADGSATEFRFCG